MKTVIAVESFDEVMNHSLAKADKISRAEPVRAERRVIFETAEDMMAYLTPPASPAHTDGS